MPYREPDPSDPSMLVGAGVDCTHEQLVEMAASFAAELAQVGYGEERILGLYRRPSYAGPHLAWRTLGEPRIVELVREAVDFWSHCRVLVEERR